LERAQTNGKVIDTQRTVARAVLSALLALLVALVVMPLGRSLAQGTRTIEIVNPDGSTSLVVSDKEFPYHLNAWVDQVPQDAAVEFELIGSDGVSRTIGLASQTTGRPDTFELFWTIPDTIADGGYTLRAILYETQGGQTPVEVARDDEAIVVNQANDDIDPDPTADAAEVADIVYPVNGGPLGVYVTPERRQGSFIIEARASSGTRFVRGYYSTARAGSEPAFVPCGGFRNTTAGATAQDPRTIMFECVVAETDFALDVTAVAVVPNDTPPPAGTGQALPEFTDAADAHTVTTYFQRAGNVSTAPEAVGNVAVGVCQVFVATVTDQIGRPIANMNVDVHATGPTDQLRFDTAGNGSGRLTSPNQPPDDGNHAVEPAAECNNEAAFVRTGGIQGEHNRPLAPDQKHVESSTGTDERGRFTFALTSDSSGETQVTMWADEDDDDLLCSQEQLAAASIGWLVAAPLPTADEPEVQTCSVAQPSPTTSPAPTVTATASVSPSVSPSASPSASPGERQTCPGYENDPRNQVVGTDDSETLEGTEGDDIICGFGGDDLILARGGDDLAFGGDGNDDIQGGDGDDDLFGEAGKDSIRGNDGSDDVDGGDSNDVVYGNAGRDVIVGGNGFDVLKGGRGHDAAAGGNGRDTLQGFTGRDRLYGGDDNDVLKGGESADTLKGGASNDTISGGKGPDRIRGGTGRDTCNGGPGRNDVRGCEN